MLRTCVWSVRGVRKYDLKRKTDRYWQACQEKHKTTKIEKHLKNERQGNKTRIASQCT